MSEPPTPDTDPIPLEQDLVNKSVEFPMGIPGFPDFKKYVFARQPEEHPFAWMRSLDDDNLAFAVIEAYHLLPDFSFEVDDADLELIGNPTPDHVAVFFIVKIVPEDRIKLIVNTNAPILINARERKGRQIVIPREDGVYESTVFEL